MGHRIRHDKDEEKKTKTLIGKYVESGRRARRNEEDRGQEN
jgi:hypothetical protein